MAPRALLCWEAGRGFGHIVHLVCVSRSLRALGWSCVLALQADRAPAKLDAPGFPMCRAPRWGEGSSERFAVSGSSASLGDMLAELGLQSAGWVRGQIAAWHRLFAEHGPDLIVAEFAPGAVLAARGRLPCVAVGAGYSVPPAGLERFPPLHDLAPVRYDEQAVRAAVNDALQTFGAEPIDNLSDTLTADAACACTLPLTDPYADWRPRPAMGTLFPDPVIRRAPDAGGLFCYMRPGPRDFSDLVADCLAELSMPVTAYLPGLGASGQARLRRAGVTLLEGIVPLTQPIARSRLVLHGGGHGLATAAIVAGVPQLILDFDIEKNLTGRLLSRRGIARRLDPSRLDAKTLAIGVQSAWEDPVLEMEAERAAVEHAAFRNRDVAGEVAQVCAGLA